MPTSLIELYSNHSEILKVGIFVDVCAITEEEGEHYIQGYDRLDESALSFFEGFEQYIHFALCFGPDLRHDLPTQNDPEVFLLNIEDCTTIRPRYTLSQFIAAPRRNEEEFT